MLRKKTLLASIVPAFVAIAGIAATSSSWIFTIGEPKLPAKFDK